MDNRLSAGGYRPQPEVREDYLESYEGDRFVESTYYARAYPNELPIWPSVSLRSTRRS